MAETLLELFRDNASRRGERPAFVFLGDGENVSTTVTFAALAKRAERCASRLLAEAAPGDRALLLLEPGPDYVESFLGCLWAGIVAVPAYPARRNSRTARIDLIVENARPRLALTDDAATAARLEGRLRVLLAGTEPRDDSDGPTLVPHAAQPEEVAFLQYTSGSTGSPRGVMVTHENLLHNERTIRAAFRPDPDEVSVTWLPPYHDMGLIGTLLQPLAVGMTTVVLTPTAFLQRPLHWLWAISKYRATYSGGPDFAYALAARSASTDAPAGLELSCWEVAYQGAERVRPETLAAFARTFEPFGFRRRAFAPCFGLAEATLMVTAVARGETAREVSVSAEALGRGELVVAGAGAGATRSFMACGRPRGGEVRIVDPVTLLPVEPPRIGEIWVSGPSVAPGYFSGDTEADSVFHATLPDSAASWLRTGDLGGLWEGELVVTGRLKDLIIVDGKNHIPEDLEASASLSHAAFVPHGSCAFSFEEDGRERVVVAQEIRRTALRSFEPEPALRALRQAVNEAHGLSLHDAAFVRPNSLPRTSSGKLRRHACRDLFLKGELARVNGGKAAAPEPSSEQTALETLIRRLVSEELKLPFEAVDPAAPLSALGLDSLSAEVLTGRLSRELGRELPPTLAYDHPTIERIASHLLDPNGGVTLGQAQGPGGAANPLRLATLEEIADPTNWEAFSSLEAETLPPRWFLFGEDAELGTAFEARLRSSRTRSRLSRPGPQDLDAAALRTGGGDDSAWDVLVRENVPPTTRFGVLSAWPVGSALFELLRAVIRVGRASQLVLRVVVSVTPREPSRVAAASGADSKAKLRAVLRSFAAKHPGADVRLIGADPTGDREAIVSALLSAGDVPEVSVRSAGLFVPRARS